MRLRLSCSIFLLFLGSTAAWAGCRAVFDETPRATNDFAHLVDRAQQGNPDAQFRLALAYESGTGTSQDYAAAVRWYKSAADAGVPAAQNNLGSMYGRGLGVTKDDAEALKWYLRAASEGHPA